MENTATSCEDFPASQLSLDADIPQAGPESVPPVEKKKAASKKKTHNEASLEEIKRRQRQLRSGRDIEISAVFAGLTIEDFKSQSKGVGLVYDAAMLDHCNEWDPEHQEKPDRLLQAYERCVKYGLVDRCVSINSRLATEEEVLKCHSREYIEKIKATSSMDMEQLMETASTYDGIYFHKTTFERAMMAVGCTLEVVEKIVKKEIRHGMALVRPPGHHAMYDEACGYCFFNNVALAAKHAVDNLGLKRVLIVDWDVHHGQGTQQLFYSDPRVLYFSIHRYEHGQFWPNLQESAPDFIGEGKGQGYNVNVALNSTGMTDSDYFAIFTQVLLPIAYQYEPQLVLVSAGYDAAVGCPEGQNEVTPMMYAHLMNMLMPLAHGRIAAVLEGGYCVESLAESVAMTLKALLGDPCPVLPPLGQPCDSVVASILSTIQHLRPYWRCLAFQPNEAPDYQPDIIKAHALPDDVKVKFFNKDTRPDKFEIYGDYDKQEPAKRERLLQRIAELIDGAKLPSYPARTCLVYDKKMMLHRAIAVDHPERPERIKRIYEKHAECGLLDRCKILKSRVATEEELSLIHKLDYVRTVASYADMDDEELSVEQYKYSSIYLSKSVYESASLSAGCLLNVVDDVMLGQSQTGVAIIRPPGHHAEYDEAMGFCYFNNAILAARYAQKRHNAKKVLILDWDVHHGNGNQNLCFDDPSILYISLHRYDHGLFFPSGEGGNYTQVGVGPGEGFNINIPWNSRGLGDSDYISAFIQIVMPVSYEFAPDLVIISAGFDAAKGDPLGGMKVTPVGYAHMTHMLMRLAGGRVIMALEGGYNLHSISESMTLCTSILLGDTCPELGHVRPTKSGAETIASVLDTHKRYWKSLQFRVPLPYYEKIHKKHEDLSTSQSNSSMDDLIEGMLELSVKTDGAQCAEGDRRPSYDFQMSYDSQLSDIDPVLTNDPKLSVDPGLTFEAPLEGATGGAEAAGGVVFPVDDALREQLGRAADGIEDLSMFAVVPLPWCEHLSCVAPVPESGLHIDDPCVECGHVGENWVCLSCYQVRCSRYILEHMLFHSLESGHLLVLSYADLSVWCYACNSYIHNDCLLPAKEAAHLNKFGILPPS